MFRRRLLLRRPLLRRPLLGAALIGGIGYLAGRRRSVPQAPTGPEATPSGRLQELDRLHEARSISDAEYAAKREELLREL
jgi:hypothetical protein